MKPTKYEVKFTTQFKKDYKRLLRRGVEIALLQEVISLLAQGCSLPEKLLDHALTGNWLGHRECHIKPDWLLIYRVEENILVLALSRMGSHSDLLSK